MGQKGKRNKEYITTRAFRIYKFRDDDPHPRRYPYFDVVVGLVWPHDPKSYAGGSVCYW
jgi:hypothetical protein